MQQRLLSCSTQFCGFRFVFPSLVVSQVAVKIMSWLPGAPVRASGPNSLKTSPVSSLVKVPRHVFDIVLPFRSNVFASVPMAELWVWCGPGLLGRELLQGSICWTHLPNSVNVLKARLYLIWACSAS